MSTIPAGLTGLGMRERMGDKATITDCGDLYTGSAIYSTIYHTGDESNPIIVAPVTERLPAGTAGLPLVSNGDSTVPSYRQLDATGVADHSVIGNNLSDGAIIWVGLRGDRAAKTLGMTYDSTNKQLKINVMLND